MNRRPPCTVMVRYQWPRELSEETQCRFRANHKRPHEAVVVSFPLVGE